MAVVSEAVRAQVVAQAGGVCKHCCCPVVDIEFSRYTMVMTITLDISPDLEEQAQKAARVEGKDMVAFVLDSLRQRLRPDVLSKAESSLLLEINAPLAPEARQQRDTLLAVQQQRELTPAEEETLAGLIDTVELANATRWQRIAELAQRRGLSLAEIAQELQIPLP